MTKIPILIPYHEDEMLYSWLYRLSSLNRYKNMIEFIKTYIYSEQKSVVRYEPKNIGGLIDIIDPDINKKTFLDIYLDTSLYSFYSILFSRLQQTYYIHSVLRPYNKNSLIGVDGSKLLLNGLKFCPMCKKEEIKQTGGFYYHRSHQLPGVNVCHKHKCALHQYEGEKGQEFSNEVKSSEIKLRGTFEQEYAYSIFAKDLLDSRLDTDSLELNDIIINELKKMNIDVKKNEFYKFHDYLKDKGLINFLETKNYTSFFKVGITTQNTSFENDIILILFSLFDNVQDIPFKRKKIDPVFYDKLNKLNYTLISEERNNAVMIQDNTCNHRFITTVNAIMSGWRCPFCDMNLTEKEIIEHIISDIGGNNFELVSDFKGWSAETKFLCKKCGTVFTTRLRKFVYEERRCLCSRYFTFEETRKKVEALNGYKLIEYKSTSQKMKVRNNLCNHEFEINYYKFFKSKRCRICYPHKILTKEQFEVEIKKITTEEYQLIGDYRYGKNEKNLTMWHKKCNKTFKTSAWYFLNGVHCPYCIKTITFKELKELVETVSDGKYICLPPKTYKTSYVMLKDTETNVEFKMYKPLVIQELTRPTPSIKLPLKSKKEFNNYRESNHMRLYKLLKKTYSDNDIIYTKDLNLKPLGKISLGISIQQLEAKKLIYAVSYSRYSFKNNSYTNYEILLKHYLKKGNQYVGFPRGDSFLYYIGYLDKEPNRIFVSSSRARVQKMPLNNDRKVVTKILPVPCKELNERNILIFGFITYLSIKQKKNPEVHHYLKHFLIENKITIEEIEQYLKYFKKRTVSLVYTFFKVEGLTCKENRKKQK